MPRLACVALAVLTACGFAPEEDFSGRRAGDGIAPWSDLGPVLLCFGNEFVGPPDSTPGGMCGDRNTTEPPCADDADCASRESCVCGRCTVQYCTALSDCRGGRVCSFAESRCDVPCIVAGDCAPGEECFGGVCRGRCASTADCQTGEICNSQNRCATAACDSDDACLAGERCFVQRVPRVATEPTVLARAAAGEPAFTMWLELSDELQQDQRAIWRATSDDGQTFRIDPARPVLEDGLAAGAPSVVRTDSGYYLYYEVDSGAELRAAQSFDGIDFMPGQTVLGGGIGPQAARAPSAVVLPDGTAAVYYQVGDGAAIALATGSLGGSLSAAGPVLEPRDVAIPRGADPEAPFWIELEAVRSPHALITPGEDGPALRMWFSAWGRESGDSFQFGEVVPIPPNYSLGYAAGDIDEPTSFVPWPFNPIFDRVSAFLDHSSELAPSVVQTSTDTGAPEDGFLLYYLDADADAAAGPFTTGRLGVAANGVAAE